MTKNNDKEKEKMERTEKMDIEYFQENFKRLRKRSKLTQNEIAIGLNIAPQSVSKWERGKSLPTIDLLHKLAKKLKCDMNEFFLQIPDDVHEAEIDKLLHALEVVEPYHLTPDTPRSEIPEKVFDECYELAIFEQSFFSIYFVDRAYFKTILDCDDEKLDTFLSRMLAEEVLVEIKENTYMFYKMKFRVIVGKMYENK